MRHEYQKTITPRRRPENSESCPIRCNPESSALPCMRRPGATASRSPPRYRPGHVGSGRVDGSKKRRAISPLRPSLLHLPLRAVCPARSNRSNRCPNPSTMFTIRCPHLHQMVTTSTTTALSLSPPVCIRRHALQGSSPNHTDPSTSASLHAHPLCPPTRRRALEPAPRADEISRVTRRTAGCCPRPTREATPQASGGAPNAKRRGPPSNWRWGGRRSRGGRAR